MWTPWEGTVFQRFPDSSRKGHSPDERGFRDMQSWQGCGFPRTLMRTVGREQVLQNMSNWETFDPFHLTLYKIALNVIFQDKLRTIIREVGVIVLSYLDGGLAVLLYVSETTVEDSVHLMTRSYQQMAAGISNWLNYKLLISVKNFWISLAISNY